MKPAVVSRANPMLFEQPNNHSTKENPLGRFMVAIEAIIELENSGKILIIQRSETMDWHPNEWEIIYGRIDQFEDTQTGLKREIREEVSITDIKIINILRVWHMFRGSEQIAENEILGVTYHCKTAQLQPKLSHEHQAYKWVTPEEALQLIKVEGIKNDILNYVNS